MKKSFGYFILCMLEIMGHHYRSISRLDAKDPILPRLLPGCTKQMVNKIPVIIRVFLGEAI